jgi:hypothetical protein
MDLNYFLSRHQTSLIRAHGASCTPSRRAHQGLAAAYASRVNAYHEETGASARLRPQVMS